MRGSVEVGHPERAAAKPSSVDYVQCLSKLTNELAPLERGLRIATASA
jgi:hypothetical protein